MLLKNPGQGLSVPFVPTSTAVSALQKLATHYSLRLPTLLSSPPSSGKSLFLQYLSDSVYPGVTNQIVSIHLSDTSLDARSLLGSYVSSVTTPGSFEWKEGVLVRAMREGKWVVLEDIDRASNEVLGIIRPLVESQGPHHWIGVRATIEIASRGKVTAAEGFSLFATRSVVASRNGALPAPTFLGSSKFHEIVIPSPSSEELHTILENKFPRFQGGLVTALIRLWLAVKALGSPASTREIGLRDFERFCIRLERLLPPSHVLSGYPPNATFLTIIPNVSIRAELYAEARDVFFGAGATTATAQAHLNGIATLVAEHLALDDDRKQWVLNERSPEFHIQKDANGATTAVSTGRITLPALILPSKSDILSSSQRPFALHRPAKLLLSRISTAISLQEPVLLTGETGTGKTSVITHLAGLLRRPLVSLNLSHQTEASDLIGGFKPIDARVPGSILQERFLDLFGVTFSRRKNEKFEQVVRKVVSQGKWRIAVDRWRDAIKLAQDKIKARQQEDAQ
jgi:midasin